MVANKIRTLRGHSNNTTYGSGACLYHVCPHSNALYCRRAGCKCCERCTR